MNGIKMEEDTKVKPEPSSPIGLGDEDEYEDTGELVMPKEKENVNQGWLAQVPKELWNALSSLPDEDQVQVGELRIWNVTQPGKEKARLKFRSDLSGWDMVPKEYDMQITSRDLKNFFIFTEKNLAGFRPSIMGINRLDRSKLQGEKGGSSYRVDKNARRGPRSIPKHTALFAVPDLEVRATPRENEEWRRIQLTKMDQANKARETVPLEMLDEHHTKDMERRARGLGVSDAWGSLTTAGQPLRRPRPQENKAARIPEDQLMDQLFRLFSEYRFYPIRVLKQKTRQPEAYLREVLSKIGVLLKKGPAANTWTLQEEWAKARNMDWDAVGETAVKDEMVAKVEDGIEDDDGDDDEDMEMEDVEL